MSGFRRQHLVMLLFFLQPLAFGSWLPRIPDVQLALGLGPAGLALALLGLPCGTLVTLPFSGPLVGRIGSRAAILVGFVIYAIAFSLPALAPTALLLFLALILAGCAISFFELALNVEADATEKAVGSLIMNTAHGFWSVGIMTGSLIGSGMAAIGADARWAIPLVGVLVLPIGLLAAWMLPREVAAPAPAGQKSAWSLPSWALLGICAFVFGITMTEGAMADWSAIFLRDMMAADPGTAGLGYTLFAAMVALSRFGGDRLKARFGAVMTARICGVLALIGVCLLYVASSLPLVLAGFAIIGIGVSVGFPLAVTAAAEVGDRASSANVAVLSFVALCGFLVGPPAIGFIAEHFDLRIGLLALLPAPLLSLLLTGRLAPRQPTTRTLAGV